ncbi:TatD family hydrolase [Teredinibacter haidensis]|uniref:TatD family hydrolase n=1 Tax=Teredinibacter haidensis TaxID=2731755 RepID=UPI000948E439|nr:TatD family hydrolase [Teredinibacter haidensis]
MLIDSHCHFDFDAFTPQRDALWEKCLLLGVKNIVIPGVEPRQWPALIPLCERYSGVYFSVGVHPWWFASVFTDSANESSALDAYREKIVPYLQHKKCVAMGECGIDLSRNFPLEKQIHILEWHCALAEDMGLPIILHCIKAHNETLQCLNKFKRLTGVLHGFSGSPELAESYWKRGFYLGVGGTITYPRASKTRNAIAGMPLESLLLETDAPDMPLNGRQGEANSPEYLPEIAQHLAELRNDSVETIKKVTTANAFRLFHRIG